MNSTIVNPTDQSALLKGLYDLSQVLSRVYGTNVPDFQRSQQGMLAPFDKFDVDLSLTPNTPFAVPGIGNVTWQRIEFAGDFMIVDESPTFSILPSTDTFLTLNQNNPDFSKAPVFLSAGKTITTSFKGFVLFWVPTANKKIRFIYSTGGRLALASQTISTIGSIIAAVNVQGSRTMFGARVAADQPVIINNSGFNYSTAFQTQTGIVANSAQNIIAAVSNVNGYELQDAMCVSSGAAAALGSFLAKTSAPAGISDGDLLAAFTLANGAFIPMQFLPNPRRVTSGKRLDRITALLETTVLAGALYSLF